jgi:glycosyltransferase involved in cell wall biosynthesis
MTTYATAWRVLREGPAPLLDGGEGAAERTPLHVAVVLPSLPAASGGHKTTLQIVAGLEERGHTCSLWILDEGRSRRLEWPAALRRKVLDHYGPVRAPVFRGLAAWYGADVAVATSWETAYAVAALPGCRARAYLLNDHEPEFHPTSVERTLAERSYRLDLHGLAGTPWLREVYEGYGQRVSTYTYGVDHDIYRPHDVARRRDTVAFYARAATPRRAVPLGVAALEELLRRRPGVRVVAFGDPRPLAAPVGSEHAGVAAPEQLARLFSEATAGLCLSLTNVSLIPNEMLACGLPSVDVDLPSTRGGHEGDAVALAPPEPVALAGELERLLDDEAEWERRSEAGRALVAGRTWARSAAEVESGLRDALRLRGAPVA